MAEVPQSQEKSKSKERISQNSKKWLKRAMIAGGIGAAGLGILHLTYGNIPAGIIHFKVGLKSLGMSLGNWYKNVLPTAAENMLHGGQAIATNVGHELGGIPGAITRPV